MIYREKERFFDKVLVIIIVLLAKTPRSEMHSAGYLFGSAGIVNQTAVDGTGGWNTGLAFLFGLLSVQWTVCDLFSGVCLAFLMTL